MLEKLIDLWKAYKLKRKIRKIQKQDPFIYD